MKMGLVHDMVLWFQDRRRDFHCKRHTACVTDKSSTVGMNSRWKTNDVAAQTRKNRHSKAATPRPCLSPNVNILTRKRYSFCGGSTTALARECRYRSRVHVLTS